LKAPTLFEDWSDNHARLSADAQYDETAMDVAKPGEVAVDTADE